MADEQSINKIERAIRHEIQPLFRLWCEKANLTEIEQQILFLKEFDERKFNEEQQLDLLRTYHKYYYDLRTYQNHWRKIKKKIFKILP